MRQSRFLSNSSGGSSPKKNYNLYIMYIEANEKGTI